MTDELTPTQALALWGLLARQGRAEEKDVMTSAPQLCALMDKPDTPTYP